MGQLAGKGYISLNSVVPWDERKERLADLLVGAGGVAEDVDGVGDNSHGTILAVLIAQPVPVPHTT